jgi:molybdate transport repressor ModE-like protein
MLDVKQLRVLKAVAEHGSFSAAADALSYTQPAISQQIAALERRAGTTLVDRGSRGVRLTDAGRALVAHADAVLARLAAAEAELARVADRLAALPAA